MHWIKDLRVVNRSICNCIAIDNSLIAFKEQLDNLIPLSPFHGDSSDNVLIDTAIFLNSINEASDIRNILQTKYCLTEIMAATH